MRPEIRRLTTEQFVALLEQEASRLTRTIEAVHLHHTWRPTRAQFKGLATIEAMRRVHVETNGWNDIAQHLTIDPQGCAWTGRNWNSPPASQAGRNGTREAGPFMIEMVGDFDAGRESLDGPQRESVISIVAALLHAFRLTTDAVWFHRDLGSPKTCPGSGVEREALMASIAAALAARGAAPRTTKKARARAVPRAAMPIGREYVLGDVAAAADEPPAGFERWQLSEEPGIAADRVSDESRDLVRVSLGQPRDVAATLSRSSEWDMLRPHVVNLTKGRLSQGGEFQMPDGSIEGIIASIDHYSRTTDTPRLMLHAHGGLVGERSALTYARDAHRWWLDQGIYPVYFVWETSAFEVIKGRLGLARGIGDWWDRRFEAAARPVGKPLWGDMKEYALLSSSTDAGGGEAGGALIFAQALLQWLGNVPAAQRPTLHAVGHSAGAIFHSHFLPRLIEAGRSIDTLALLAPAVRIDLFKTMLLPAITAGTIRRFEMYTMDDEAERDDDLIAPLGVPVYGKSLLYLVSGAFEPEKDAAILGMEARFREDDDVDGLFSSGTARLELSHAKGKPHNPNTKSRKHGCFDNDNATLTSVFTTIAGASPHSDFPVRDASCEKASSRAMLDLLGPVPAVSSSILSAPAASAPFVSVSAAALPVRAAIPGRKRALCIGIDSYPSSPLAGCVRDAQAWAGVLRSLNFEVTTLLDVDATRARVLEMLGTFVESSQPGDTIVFQYSGHGTQAEDLNGDEADRYDEALVPVDYQSGALLLDDDLADVYRRLPRGAVLTLFMDCCHSGTNSRFAPFAPAATSGTLRRRFLPLTPELEAAHRAFRARAGSPPPTTAEESLPGLIHFAACLDNEYSYESDGQGHFTKVATGAIAAAVAQRNTNEAFARTVASGVIAIGQPQTPRLMRLPADLANRVLLEGSGGQAATSVQGTGVPADRALDEWCLQIFESGVVRFRERLGR